MLINTFSEDDTGFEKNGSFYQFENSIEAHLGCGSCIIYSDKTKKTRIKEGYCLDGEYICSQINNKELSQNANKIEEMFRKIGK